MKNLSHPTRGSALIISLIILLVLTLLGITALSTSTQQEHMAGNTRDLNVAFQAAEATLRDAERYLDLKVSPLSNFTAACTAGLCLPALAMAVPQWQAQSWTGPVPLTYGTNTTTPPFNGVVQQPRYLIEFMGLADPRAPGNSLSVGKEAPLAIPALYRITAVGWGRTTVTQVMLQTIIKN